MTDTAIKWTIKMNDAAARRYNKLLDEGVTVDVSTHQGRQLLGYNYLEILDPE